MTATIAVLATLDTKGPEAAYLAQRLRERGLTPLIVDCGILGDPLDVVPDVSADDVVEDRAGDLVEAEDVHHRVDDHHVAGAYQRAELVAPRRDRGDHHLRDADREPHQRAGGHDGALGAADADAAGDAALPVQVRHVVGEHRPHRGDRAAAGRCGAQLGQ
jgi:hypothetical protein